jgi:hypothetical protein
MDKRVYTASTIGMNGLVYLANTFMEGEVCVASFVGM